MIVSLEIFLNFAWLAVAVSLWALCFARSTGAREGCKHHSAATQLIALAMVTAILLPAISITDDLHACQFPAEIKLSVSQNERHPAPIAQPGFLWFALALLAFYLSVQDPRGRSRRAAEPTPQGQTRGHLRALWSRPPPMAIA